MKIGYFLGSFDPPHIGHMHLIAQALSKVDLVVLVPTMQNPWKKEIATEFGLRVKMCEKAIKPFGDRVQVLTIEQELEPPFYSYKTLKKIKETWNNDELYILCGNDVYGEMHNWMNSEWIFQNFIPLPTSRNIIPLSSTIVRQYAEKGLELYPYVHENVKEIIESNDLYKNEKLEL